MTMTDTFGQQLMLRSSTVEVTADLSMSQRLELLASGQEMTLSMCTMQELPLQKLQALSRLQHHNTWMLTHTWYSLVMSCASAVTQHSRLLELVQTRLCLHQSSLEHLLHC